MPAVMLLAIAVRAADKGLDQSCTGEVKPAVTATNTGVGVGGPASGHTDPAKPYSIKLVWGASVPAKNDSVAGYYIFRRESGKSCDQTGSHCQQLNPNVPIEKTSCIDYQVKPGHTYFYEARAVSGRGVLSGFSNEAKASLPPK
jgi:hypothetical protein